MDSAVPVVSPGQKQPIAECREHYLASREDLFEVAGPRGNVRAHGLIGRHHDSAGAVVVVADRQPLAQFPLSRLVQTARQSGGGGSGAARLPASCLSSRARVGR